ncbi:condensation domain-containing protein [Caulobacter sp. NIBR2454]|uniref:condensation domain-containing protein n=1 Tax=Caulobacter sp. NIBR2454 TaxID=3015996 RepID=UPI0022B70D40|nr:condensation domain-containing protein [Caulobacter sp. NIBR2454]
MGHQALSLRESLALPYFYSRFGPTGSGPGTNLVYAAKLTGPLDVQAVRRAFEELARETPSLRGYFSGPGAEPARLTSPVPPPFNFIDAQGDGPGFKAAVRRAADQNFEVSAFPLLEATLVRRRADVHVLVLAAHHLLMDGFSIVMLLRAISNRVRGRTAVTRKDADYDVGAEAKARLAFLQSQEAAALKARAVDWMRPAAVALWPREQVFFPMPKERHGLVRLAREPVQAASKTLGLKATALHRLLLVLLQHAITRSPHAAFSEAHANRPPSRPDLYGFMSDDLLARVDLDASLSIVDLVARIDQSLTTARGFSAIPCSRILQALDSNARPLPRFHFNPLSIAAGALRLPNVEVRPFKIMPAYSVAELVFVSGDLERVFIALAHGQIEGLDIDRLGLWLNLMVERLAAPNATVGQVSAELA